MSIDVCICTHNPRLEVFTIVLTAIANQTIAKDTYQVWIIDNASDPPISDLDLAPLVQAGITYHLLQEPRLGNMYARELASQAIPGESLIFVDDDNELSLNYLEIAIEILDRHPEIGFFGGKLLSGIKVDYPNWMEELLPYLGIKDLGDEPISKCIQGDYHWGEWEPPCAGAVIRKVVLQQYFKNLQKLPPNLVIGRRGKQGLLSMADSWLAHCTYELGLECAYQPRLQLIHHINPERLQFEYLFKLLYNYGRSDVILKQILDRPVQPNSIELISEIIEPWYQGKISVGSLICLMASQAGFSDELSRKNPVDFIDILDKIFQQKMSEDRQKLSHTQAQSNTTQHEFKDAQTQLTSTQQELNHARSQIATIQQKFNDAQTKIAATQQKFNDAQTQIRSMQQTKFWKLRKAWFWIKQSSGI